MCGIAGIIVPDARRYRPQAEKMIAALRHRGPDAQAILDFPNALLIHTRLSIVDLAGGGQPMRSVVTPDVAVTFNGEIYGYRELKSQFPNYPYQSTSDTELILALYHALSERFVQRLPGMFALAIWDDHHQALYAARDRFGEKPFYYALFKDDAGRPGLVFASEIKAILATGLITAKLNRDALAYYLQNLYVHPRQTIYENIQTLPPAHMLKFSFGEVETHHYWQLPETRENISATDAIEQFRALLDQAVARQLVADVPVGAFLSGGLDSSTIVGVTARHKKGINTFAFRFDRGLDETSLAAEVAAMHGTTHRILEDTQADIAGLLLEMAGVYDEPFADSSNIPTYLISKLAREHLKVVLTGDGGDELLAGYPWYRKNQSAADTLYFSNATLEKFGLAPSQFSSIAPANPDRAMRADLLNYMPGDILVKIDRASMAHALELRAPFLDIDLASFLISLPQHLKLTQDADKYILRQAFTDLWPASVRSRGKHGFGAPVTEWITRPAVAKLAAERLNDSKHPLYLILPFDATRIAVERKNYQTWILLTLALWLEHSNARLT